MTGPCHGLAKRASDRAKSHQNVTGARSLPPPVMYWPAAHVARLFRHRKASTGAAGQTPTRSGELTLSKSETDW